MGVRCIEGVETRVGKRQLAVCLRRFGVLD